MRMKGCAKYGVFVPLTSKKWTKYIHLRSKNPYYGGYFNLMLCSVMLPHFICKIWCLNEQNLMLCYAVLWFVMLTYFMSKILCSQWVKSCDLLCSHFWEIMIEIFVSKTLCTVMNSYLMSKILLDLMKLTVSYCNQE